MAKKNVNRKKWILAGSILLIIVVLAFLSVPFYISGAKSQYYVGDSLSVDVVATTGSLRGQDCVGKYTVFQDGYVVASGKDVVTDNDCMSLGCYDVDYSFTSVGSGYITAEMRCDKVWDVNNPDKVFEPGYLLPIDVANFKVIEKQEVVDPKSTLGCGSDSDIHWFDNYGVEGEEYKNCLTGSVCRVVDGSPKCISNVEDQESVFVAESYKRCIGDELFWYNSDGEPEVKISDCSDKCVFDACVNDSYTEIEKCDPGFVADVYCLGDEKHVQVVCNADEVSFKRLITLCPEQYTCSVDDGCVEPEDVVVVVPVNESEDVTGLSKAEACEELGGVLEGDTCFVGEEEVDLSGDSEVEESFSSKIFKFGMGGYGYYSASIIAFICLLIVGFILYSGGSKNKKRYRR